MAIDSIPHAGPGEPEEREYAYRDRRAWLAAVIASEVARATSPALEPDGAALDVASSYGATFHPLAMPAVGHAYRMPDGSIEHDGTYAVLPRAEEYEDKHWGRFRRGADDERIPCTGLETREELEPLIRQGWTLHLDDQIRPAYLTRPGPRARPYRVMITWAFDAGGGFVRDRDGRIVRDRREVARLLRGWPDLQRFALALCPEAAPGGRKRCAPWTIARGLLFADLQPALGTRPAARLLLAWEDELGAPWRTPGAAGLVARFEAGGEFDAEERRRLRRAEQTMVRSCRRSGVDPTRAS
jgi:hypothetical protein